MERQKLKLEGDDSDSDSFINRVMQNSRKKASLLATNKLGISFISKPEDIKKFINSKESEKDKEK
jgi:hypothetical protein